jgi:hypothetical protein
MDRTDREAIQVRRDYVLFAANCTNVFLNSVSNYIDDSPRKTAMKRLQGFRFELRPNGGAHVAAGNRRTQASFKCLACGFEEHADVVGACNVLARGLRVIACGAKAQSGHAMKQEPARDNQVLA